MSEPKVGDEVRIRTDVVGVVKSAAPGGINEGLYIEAPDDDHRLYLYRDSYRKADVKVKVLKPAPEPVRPVEPTEVGTVVRVKRTGLMYCRRSREHYWCLFSTGFGYKWDEIIKPGDEIEVAVWPSEQEGEQ